MIAGAVGEALTGCEWVGIPFAGGCCELLEIKARTIVVNDLHRHLINLAGVVANPSCKATLQRRLGEMLFHPNELKTAQMFCEAAEQGDVGRMMPVPWAVSFFACCWMTRSGAAGTPQEFKAGQSLRWEAAGGDSNRRFRSAMESLDTFHRAMVDRCTFSTLDVFDFLDKCKDRPKHGIYCDPPFYGPGAKYTHAPKTDADQEAFHRQLAGSLGMFDNARIVVRAYDVPLIRELYNRAHWTWQHLNGRKQTNAAAPDVLIVSKQGNTNV